MNNNNTETTYPTTDYNNFQFMCGCGMENNKYKTDCYFYKEYQEMGGKVITCSFDSVYGSCPCDNCERYISKSQVYKMVKEIIEKKCGE